MYFAAAGDSGSSSLLDELKELLVQQFVAVSGTADRSAGDDRSTDCHIHLPAWLSNQYPANYSIAIDGSKLKSAFQCNGPNPTIPNISALTASRGTEVAGAGSGASAGAGSSAKTSVGSAHISGISCSEETVKQSETLFSQLLAKLRLEEDFRSNAARASEEWRALEGGEVGAVAEDVQEVLTSTLFPSNRFTRRRPDYAGSSLSTKGLIRWAVKFKANLNLSLGIRHQANETCGLLGVSEMIWQVLPDQRFRHTDLSATERWRAPLV